MQRLQMNHCFTDAADVIVANADANYINLQDIIKTSKCKIFEVGNHFAMLCMSKILLELFRKNGYDSGLEFYSQAIWQLKISNNYCPFRKKTYMYSA